MTPHFRWCKISFSTSNNCPRKRSTHLTYDFFCMKYDIVFNLELPPTTIVSKRYSWMQFLPQFNLWHRKIKRTLFACNLRFFRDCFSLWNNDAFNQLLCVVLVFAQTPLLNHPIPPNTSQGPIQWWAAIAAVGTNPRTSFYRSSSRALVPSGGSLPCRL